MLLPVIMSGGAGSRLWPVSRETLTKPFIELPDGRTLLQKTLQRTACLDGVSEVLTVTNKEYYFLTRDVYEATDTNVSHSYLLETIGRNTAPAIAVAALHAAAKHGEDVVLLVMPADHLIGNQKVFSKAVTVATDMAVNGWIVTFGVEPSTPETGYGYIEGGESIGDSGARRVVRFVEKPDLETAEKYIALGRFTWNAGIFCFTAKTIIAALAEYVPEVLEIAKKTLASSDSKTEPVVLGEEHFASSPDISIDYAVMERASKVAVVAADFDWSDIGSWSAMAELVQSDERGNRVNGEALLVDANNCYIQSDSRLVAGIGIDNLLVVDTPDALLVAHHSRAQDVKTVVKQLKLESHSAANYHRKVHRPWGTYTVLEEGANFKIKCIKVKPGASLSLQMHHHRSEHWVVVSGIAKVVNGERELLINANESTYIPAGHKHRLENPGLLDLVIIEVQSGEYLGEDDIVRFQDIYGRT
ncbi:mannose-1-phosphate guanylyltransferase/mannose-6-phosphate isomerase [Methylobacillus flagellatus]|uniref:mannose-1-phosphate guanylyltransferase n=1 Tax=Methylobacillus flagellatus (strain ATCC 51484 / DSM 6875 / VKM B-1610 / KT) TaxID=265072 RepID=Q1H1V1_METFK|nr:mannose-1-phosphate guanylyltransferase/mannose-6-phosphate isomerase [Methylobacillus flagellatus]ABE49536.1 mannose-6-phosphate isomerase, type 2 [Methylobacillus flagellatus KT]